MPRNDYYSDSSEDKDAFHYRFNSHKSIQELDGDHDQDYKVKAPDKDPALVLSASVILPKDDAYKLRNILKDYFEPNEVTIFEDIHYYNNRKDPEVIIIFMGTEGLIYTIAERWLKVINPNFQIFELANLVTEWIGDEEEDLEELDDYDDCGCSDPCCPCGGRKSGIP